MRVIVYLVVGSIAAGFALRHVNLEELSNGYNKAKTAYEVLTSDNSPTPLTTMSEFDEDEYPDVDHIEPQPQYRPASSREFTQEDYLATRPSANPGFEPGSTIMVNDQEVFVDELQGEDTELDYSKLPALATAVARGPGVQPEYRKRNGRLQIRLSIGEWRDVPSDSKRASFIKRNHQIVHEREGEEDCEICRGL